MSALNVIFEPDRAHLITDGASYDLAGVVQDVCSKVVRCEALGVVIGFSGRTHPQTIAAELALAGPGTGAELLACLPALAGSLKRLNTVARPRDEASGDNDVQLVAVVFDHAAGRPRAFMVSTNAAWMGESFPVLTLVEVRGIITPAVDTAAAFEAWPLAFSDDAGRAVLELQRRTPFAVPGGNQWCVGGFGERHTVSAAGIQRVELVRWPDRVGERIKA